MPDSVAPEVSVVVPTRDRAQRLSGLLRSLRGQTIAPARFEVIVVDDGSRDRTPLLLREAAGRSDLSLTSVRLEGRGPAAARNVGWRSARAALIAFTDDDCEAAPGWLAAMLRRAGTSEAAVVQGPTVPMPWEHHRRGVLSRTRSIPLPSPWFETCNILYPRAMLETLGGFDEAFPDALGEDTDLGWRALEAGARHAFAPDAVVYHAIDRLSLREHLRTALRGPDAVLVFKRHPELRKRTIRYGAFRNPAHANLLLAVAGVAASRRAPAAAALSAPYVVGLARRARAAGASPLAAAYLLLYDLLQTYASARGSLRHRVLAL